MDQQHLNIDPNQPHYMDMDQQTYDQHPHNMMQPMHQQQPHMYYPPNQVYTAPQVQPSTSVNFSSFQPDPNVLAFQGQPYPTQLNVLAQNPMPLLPTEPLPPDDAQLSVPNVVLSEKKKTPTKHKRKSSELSSTGQVPFKKIPEYVSKLLEMKHSGFADRDFAERALSNLARKLANQVSVLDEWTRAIFEGDNNSGCVCVPRPKDGRMTITKVTGSTGCKKVFPQIFVCQVFRWPNIVFHHDIKSSNHCQNPGVIKPSLNTTTDKSSDNSNLEETKEVICVNPFHYELTPEVEARFKKQSKSIIGGNKSNAIIVSRSDIMDSASSVTSDEDESDDEILQFKDDGIDYAYLWDEQSIKPKSAELQDIKMDNSLLEELKFFTLNKDLKKFTPTDDAYLEKLGIVHELETIIKSGEYRKLIKQQEISPAEPAKADLSKVQASITKVPQEKKLLLKMTPSSSVTKSATSIAQIATKAPDHELMPPPAKVNSPPVIASIVTPAQNRTSETAPEDEDNAIQNLLDDIRGSFERQFDDEFNDFTETAASEGDGNSRNSSPFGNINIGPTFSMSDGHALEDLAASAEDLLASSPDEMLLEGFTMSQEVFDNFLEAETSNSSESQFSFQQQQDHGPHQSQF